jgi:uncharacterized protein with NAD-binding domain and iron-sulfur cluster
MIRRTAVLAAAIALALPAAAQQSKQDAPAPTQSEVEIFRQKVAADKKLVVSDNLRLTDAEAKAFWPVYNEYQKELQGINDRLLKTIKAYADAYNKGPVPDATAKSLLTDTIAVEEAEVQMKKSFVPKLEKVLPEAKVARYIQIENKIRALVKLDLAANIPLVK